MRFARSLLFSAAVSRRIRSVVPVLSTVPRRVRPLSATMTSLASPPAPSGTCRVAVCQLLCGSDKTANLETATAAIREAARNKANIVVLPECWNSPYATDKFPEYAEPVPKRMSELDPARHVSSAAMSAVARETGVYLVGGE